MHTPELKTQSPIPDKVPRTRSSDTTLRGEVAVSLMEYGPHGCHETLFSSVEEGLAYQTKAEVLWLNVYGLANPDLMQAIGQRFGLHPLVQEDILSVRQRPKVEEYDSYLFLATRVFHYLAGEERRLQSEPMYMVVGQGFVLTFQPHPLGVFGAVRERLKKPDSMLLLHGADFLAYTLIDAVIDDYFGVLDDFGNRVEAIDRQLLADKSGGVLRSIHRLKHEGMRLRRALLPLRDMLNQMTRGELPQFRPETRLWLRDAFDHCLHLLESLDASRDMVAGMLDLYLSIQSNRLNVQMRVLTIISIIFMPLTLIAGIYGMNFDYMPELHWRWGYFAVLAVMGLIGVGIALSFSRRRWL